MKPGNGISINSVLIFNIGSAHDCANLGTEHCQVDANECYAVADEKTYKNALEYRRRQEFLWDSMDADLFADALIEMISRKKDDVDVLRFGESGDLRHQADLDRVDRVAERLHEHGILTFIYTASEWLDFSDVEHITVTASNDGVPGDQYYNVVDEKADIPDDGFYCPISDPESEKMCGECLECMTKDGPDEIYATLQDR